MDTNCDPDEVDYVILGNDDATRAVKLLTETMAKCSFRGKQRRTNRKYRRVNKVGKSLKGDGPFSSYHF